MEDQTEKRLRELAERSWSRGIPCFTDFLDLGEQTVLGRIRRSLPQPEIRLYGGAEGCERKMAGFGTEEVPFPISCMKISPRGMKFAADASHRDVLGALMGLGFERSLLGDIVLREKEAYVFCAERIAPFIADNLRSVGRTEVFCVPADGVPEGELFRTKRMTVQVSSERLDALIAHVFRLSRGNAQALFPSGRVFLDGMECIRTDAMPETGQIVSVRGYGRFRFAGAGTQSRKGKWNAEIELYI